MKSLKETLIERDGLTSGEADEAISKAQKNLLASLEIGRAHV